MAVSNLPKNEIVKKRVSWTIWLCPDGHQHETEAAAQECLAGRPARLRSERKWREREALARKLARQHRAEQKLREKETAEFKAAWKSSEIFASELDPRVSMALFAHGAADRKTFREQFVTQSNSLDIPKLGRVAMLNVDDYAPILRWLNSE